MRALKSVVRAWAGILGHTGTVSMVSGAVIAAGALAAVLVRDEPPVLMPYLVPGGALVLVGALLSRIGLVQRSAPLGIVEGSVVIVLSWVLATASAAVSFGWAAGLDVTRAVFEATSGWTTTGLSVVLPSTAAPGVLLLRSLTQLAGGAGLAIIMLSTLAGPRGVGLSAAEGRTEQLAPNVRASARIVLWTYSIMTVASVVALLAVGMNGFDAVNHAFAAISTGGFSTRDASIGHWDSPAIEAVIVLVMVAGNLSFLTSYAFLRGRFRDAFRTSELRLFLVLAAIGAAVLFLDGMTPFAEFKRARVAIFEAVTALTTTGFQTVGYGEWPALGWWVLILLMIVGGGAGSTAGGIKQYRVDVLLKGLVHDVRGRLRSRRMVNEAWLWRAGERRFLNADDLVQAGLFLALYLAALAVGTAVLAGHGYSLDESLFEFASAIGTVGLSVGVTSPAAPDAVLWTETFGMLLGRLEFYTVFVATARLLADLRTLTAARSWKASRAIPGRAGSVAEVRGPV